MAQVHDVVGRLLQRPQHLERQRLLGGVALETLEHALEPLGRARLVDVDGDAVVLRQHGELLQPPAIGRVVDAPHRVLTALAEAARHRLVGGEHELLDHGIRLLLARIAPRLADRAHQPRIVVVQLDERFGDIEVQRAARQARLPELARQRIHRAQIRQQRLVFAPLAARVARQRRRDAGIVQPRARVDHRRRKIGADDVRVAIEVDARDHRQPVFLRDQRTDARRQRLGQHRDGAAGQVDAAPALARLGVDRRPLAHVVRDVGDRDPQPRAAVGPGLDRHRVVEVARRLRIDGRERNVAQIGAIDAVGVAHLLRQAVGVARDVVGEVLLDAGHRQDLLDLGARVIGIAQYLQHRGLDRPVGNVGITRDLGDHRRAVRRVRHGAGQRHRAADARVVRLQDLLLAAPAELAGDLGAAARQHGQHAPFDALAAQPGLDLDGVGVHGGAAVVSRHVDVFGFVVGYDEAIPGGVNLDATRELARLDA